MKTRLQGVVLAVAMAVATMPSEGVAQEAHDDLTPRSLTDSTYGVRVAVDALMEAIRRGRLDSRVLDDPTTSAAVAHLASAAARRSRRPPHPDLGVLWDLHIDVTEFEALSRDSLRATAYVFLATDADTVQVPVTLTFQRRGNRWWLAAHDAFLPRLAALTARLTGGTRP